MGAGSEMQCLGCQREFGESDRIATMSGSIMGDEVTDTYFLCPDCGVYTVAQWWDDFTGEETLKVSGPVSREDGDTQVQVIRGCDQPWNKKCRCDAHRDHFNDQLD